MAAYVTQPRRWTSNPTTTGDSPEVIRHEGYTENQQRVLKNDGPQTLLLDRLSWARSYLKGMKLLTNPQRAVWAVTEAGQVARVQDLKDLHEKYLAEVKAGVRQDRSWGQGDAASPKKRRHPSAASGPSRREPDEDFRPNDTEWKERLLGRLLRMDPTAFEHLAQRLLREAGFSEVVVTGKSGDGGIDGRGTLQVSLLSFPVFFQCKRYQGSVGSSAIRDFRGAMAGRGDKGLLISTGTFTAEARREAKREGAQPIDLIDGDAMCDLLKDHGLGVRVVETVDIMESFFDGLDEPHGRVVDSANAAEAATTDTQAPAPRRARRDVARHVTEVLEELPAGRELTISQIASQRSSQYLPGEISQGAIAARLNSPNGVPGVEVVRDSSPIRVRRTTS